LPERSGPPAFGLSVEDFDYTLDPARIALRPVAPRDAARLMISDGDRFLDRQVKDLPAIIRSGDVLVVNDSRVIPARIRGLRGQAAIEATLMRPVSDTQWQALARPAKRLHLGDAVQFEGDLAARVVAKDEGGWVGLDFDRGQSALLAHLERFGAMPLPPYIASRRPADTGDATDYQTVYAKVDGSVAAPTAGLHFTDALLARLEAGGVERLAVTLHVGAGTFLGVTAPLIDQHKMHAESGEVTEAVATRLNAARRAGGRIIAVGTTSLRLLETAAAPDGTITPFRGQTTIFIKPGHKVAGADLLLTNFHLPRSTLLMLVAAFAGYDRMRAGYAHALAHDYRFYSYGDAGLWSRQP